MYTNAYVIDSTTGGSVRRTKRSAAFLAAASAASFLLLATAAPALATDRFVDDSAGVGLDTGDCSSPVPISSNPHICKTIAYAITQSQSGDVIHLGGGDYPESLTLPAGVSLRQDNYLPPVTSGTATVDGGASAAITIASGDAEVRGLTLRGGATTVGSLVVQGSASPTIAANTFDDASPNQQLLVAGGSPRITGNTFIGTDDGTTRRAISIFGAGSPVIAGNTISDFYEGILSAPQSGQVTLAVRNNTITGVNDADGSAIGTGIHLQNDTEGTIAHNVIEPAAGETFGIGIQANLTEAGLSLHLRRNRITDFPSSGVVVGSSSGDGGPLTLAGDLIAGNEGGLFAAQIGGGVEVENATITDSTGGNDIHLNGGTALTLDSTIVGAPISTAGTGNTCAIGFSRGPTTSGSDCERFQTSADPRFVDPAGGDFHLRPGSPLIDRGNPAPPALAADIDGDRRAVEGGGACDRRRDIGADEFVPASPFDCRPPDTKIKRVRVSGDDVVIKFRSTERGSHFRCKLDRTPFKRCLSPKRYRHLDPGTHRFKVRAIDRAGNVDPTPAKKRFRVRG